LKINDISVGGISLTTEKRLTIGNEYALKLQGRDTQLTIKGTVMWSLLSESIADSIGNVIPIFKTGIQFIDLSTDQENEIIKFIEAHKKEPEEKIDVYSLSGNRLFVRFRLKEADKATLQEQDDYKVKNISLSGLLIESKHALKLEDKINMQMALPDNKIISFLGRVVTCTMTKRVGSESYDIGMEFIDIAEKDEKALKNFISLLG
jgi:c-di-GMP-binding flagellar brake protein YcgR